MSVSRSLGPQISSLWQASPRRLVVLDVDLGGIWRRTRTLGAVPRCRAAAKNASRTCQEPASSREAGSRSAVRTVPKNELGKKKTELSSTSFVIIVASYNFVGSAAHTSLATIYYLVLTLEISECAIPFCSKISGELPIHLNCYCFVTPHSRAGQICPEAHWVEKCGNEVCATVLPSGLLFSLVYHLTL